MYSQSFSKVKQEAIARATAETKQKEVQDFKALLKAAERFDEATRLRNYAEAVQKQADPLDEKIWQWR